MASDFGALSLVPPLLAIVLAVVTRRAILSLFVGVWIGAVIAVQGLGVVQTFDWVIGSMTDSFNAEVMLFIFLLGAGIALIWRMGGSLAVANWATKRLDSRRKVGLAAWLLGMVWFFDDYANTAIVGSSMKSIADEMRMSREKLAYILDSTAAPVATFGISSWVAYQISMINTGYRAAGIADTAPSAFVTFLRSIPYNVYCLLAVLMVGIVVVTRRDFGEMLDAETRARETGKLYRDGAKPLQSIKEELGAVETEEPMLRLFILPVAALVAVVVVGAVWTGYAPNRDALAMAENADFIGALVWGSFAMVATAIALSRAYDIMGLDEAMDTVIDGFGIMLNAISILVLAWSIGTVAEELGTGQFVTGIAQGVVTPTLLPIVILFAAAVISFSIGTSWGTMALVTPVAIPMAWEISGGSNEMLAVATGAVFSGAIFGDHCSPISDTTILSSTFAGSDHVDHVRTQIYYALTVVSVATLVYLLYGLTGLSQFVLLPAGVVVLVALVYGLSEWDARRKNLSATPSADAAGETTSDD
ncbi:Na+/H+ antiporter NhaC family protein [Halegenticoccus tardaugens]|uniref:Na+/H+ antiporter NhaC family protein n=1 Tax=Halegenticoccus tardaugens TaxID=2071624 RepID=UPI00100B3F52|nr:Na+/H+ antiporter NhaC family protein [Halegenticoccus tardaugens]